MLHHMDICSPPHTHKTPAAPIKLNPFQHIELVTLQTVMMHMIAVCKHTHTHKWSNLFMMSQQVISRDGPSTFLHEIVHEILSLVCVCVCARLHDGKERGMLGRRS